MGTSKSGTDDTRLGTLLLQNGIVSEKDLQHCLEVQALTGGRWPLGQILIEQGVLTQETLDEFLAVQQALRQRAPLAVEGPVNTGEDGVLDLAVSLGVNDLMLSEGRPPLARLAGQLVPLAEEPLAGPELWGFVRRYMGIDVLELVAEHGSVTMSMPEESGARGRVTAFRHFDGLAVSVRMHPAAVRTPEEIGLDEGIAEAVRVGRGLVLLAGEASAGVTETFATLLGVAAEVPFRSVLVLDGAFEYPVPDGPALVTRRCVGDHTRDWASGLRAALREEPDVVFVGDVDAESLDLAVHAAESGALVVACVRAPSAVAAIERVIGFHAAHDQARVRSALASALLAVMAVRTVPDAERRGLALATELLPLGDAARDLVRTGALARIRSLLRVDGGGHSMDASLLGLVDSGRVLFEDAFEFAQDKALMLDARRGRVGKKR